MGKAGIDFLLQQSDGVPVSAAKASKSMQGVLVAAKAANAAGNNISLQYTDGGTAGIEAVTVTDSAILVQIEAGVTTAAQLIAAIEGDTGEGGANGMVDVELDGPSNFVQQVQPPTFLEGGADVATESFHTLGGLRSKSLSFNSEAIDITNHGSQEWKELLDGKGLRSMSVSGSGIFDSNAALARMQSQALANAITRYQLIDADTGNAFRGAFKITSIEYAGEHNGEKTWSLSIESSGEVGVISGS
jgi:TP901-1 family phage major tail protein